MTLLITPVPSDIVCKAVTSVVIEVRLVPFTFLWVGSMCCVQRMNIPEHVVLV